MATIKFLLQSKSNNSQIYVRLSAGRNLNLKKKTGFVVDSNNWSEKTNLPKQNSAENKSLTSNLNRLETYIYDSYNSTLSTDEIMDSNWLEKIINQCFGRIEQTDNTILLNHVQYIIDNAHTRKIKGRNKLGLSESRIKGYITFKNLIERYQKQIKKQIRFIDINRPFVTDLTHWLMKTEKYSINYAGKQIDNLKTVCLDAQKNEIPTHGFVNHIERFKENKEDRSIVTLSFEELKRIRNLELKSSAHQNVRNWIMLGCSIGQRGGDLMNLTIDNFRVGEKGYYIDLIQQKGTKENTLPVVDDYVVNILASDFPYKISVQKLNEYIKEICKLAEINTLMKGKKMNPKTKRKEIGIYPKYELVSSHCFRRSFATNHYKRIPTAVLMGITGHEKESTFLIYINQNGSKDANADLFREYYEMINKDEKTY